MNPTTGFARWLGRLDTILQVYGWMAMLTTNGNAAGISYRAIVQDLGNMHVLEFGCNVGGTAIVFAHLGAAVTAVDIDPRTTALAQANALRYGANDIGFAVLPGGSTPLP